jgi:hypothetical protein
MANGQFLVLSCSSHNRNLLVFTGSIPISAHGVSCCPISAQLFDTAIPELRIYARVRGKEKTRYGSGCSRALSF